VITCAELKNENGRYSPTNKKAPNTYVCMDWIGEEWIERGWIGEV
jgi:hypothetical protein